MKYSVSDILYYCGYFNPEIYEIIDISEFQVKIKNCHSDNTACFGKALFDSYLENNEYYKLVHFESEKERF